MGLLEELIILVKETIDEVNERNRPRPTTAPESPRSAGEAAEDAEREMEAMRQRFARRAAEARAAEEVAAERETQQQAEVERQRHAREREHHHQKQVQAVRAAKVAHHHGAVDRRRIARLVRQPNALRELIVLREILDKPLALRRR